MAFILKLSLYTFILLAAIDLATSTKFDDSKKVAESSKNNLTKDYYNDLCVPILLACAFDPSTTATECDAVDSFCGAIVNITCGVELVFAYLACDTAFFYFNPFACVYLSHVVCNECTLAFTPWYCSSRSNIVRWTMPKNQTKPSIKYEETLNERIQLHSQSQMLLLPFQENQSTVGKVIEKEETCPYSSSDAKTLLQSVEKTVSFYEKNMYLILPKEVSLEGLAVLINEFSHLHEKFSSGSYLYAYMEKLMDSSKKILKTYSIMKHQVRGDIPVITGPIDAWKSSEVLSNYTGQFLNIGNEREIVLKYGWKDFCLNSVEENCIISTACQSVFLEEANTQYFLVNQVKLLQIPKSKSCVLKNEKGEEVKNVHNFEEQLCAKTLEEANLLAKFNYPLLTRSLFVKQIAYCGMAGYPNFMRSDWMKEILSWQSKGYSGCFPEFFGEHLKTGDTAINILLEMENGATTIDSCLLDLTSSSLSALVVQLRHMADMCSPQIFDL